MHTLDTLEKERLHALQAYGILDTPPEKIYDDITSLAATICVTPISFISLLTNDRQWLKSKKGTAMSEAPLLTSFCQHAIGLRNTIEVCDTLQDTRFHENPLVINPPPVRFYASSPLMSYGGHVVGTLCVMDTVPKKLTMAQRNALDLLAVQAIVHMEHRLRQHQLESEKQQLQLANENLEDFVHMVSHDLEEPIMNINSVAEWMLEDLAIHDYEHLTDNLHLIQERAGDMKDLVEGLLQYAVVQEKGLPKVEVNVKELLKGILKTHRESPGMQTHLPEDLPVFLTERILLHRVLSNLISNAHKYHHTGKGNIWVDIEEEDLHYTFCVKDDGPGIPQQSHEKVFGLFERLLRDVERAKGSGIGLAIVKKIIERRGGQIWVESELDKGATFLFTWLK